MIVITLAARSARYSVPPTCVKIAVLLEIVLQGDRTGHLAALDKLENRLIQALMYRGKKVVRAQKVADFFHIPPD